MKIKVINEPENLQEVMQVLLTHLEPSKVMKFWAACQLKPTAISLPLRGSKLRVASRSRSLSLRRSLA